MQAESERQGDEPDRGGALSGLEPSHGGSKPEAEADDEREPEQEGRQARVGEQLQRQAVRLGHVGGIVAIPLPRDLEGARPRAAGRMGAEHLPRLAPPHRAVVRLEAAEPARVVRDLARAADLVGRPGERVTHARNEADRSGHGDERNGTDERTHDIPPAGRDESLDGDEGDEREHEERRRARSARRAAARPRRDPLARRRPRRERVA